MTHHKHVLNRKIWNCYHREIAILPRSTRLVTCQRDDRRLTRNLPYVRYRVRKNRQSRGMKLRSSPCSLVSKPKRANLCLTRFDLEHRVSNDKHPIGLLSRPAMNWVGKPENIPRMLKIA